MRVYFETYGCTMNQGDTEIMRGIAAKKFEIVESPEACDVAVINSCGVVQRTENKVLRRMRLLRERGKKVLIAGCLPRINYHAVEGADGAVSALSLNLINEALERVAGGERFVEISDKAPRKVCVHKERKKGVTAIVPISEGCLGGCSYCATRYARGRLRSFKVEAVVREVEEAVKHGYREIRLTAQDTAAYGADTGESLPELLRRICEVEGEFRVRVGMMNPASAKAMADELVECYAEEKLYKFLHLPVQSGDDEVLEKMKRGYCVEDFLSIVRVFKNPGVTLATDVIVGYPGESEESFTKTYRLVEKIKPDVLNVKRFSPRPGTPAAKLKDMPDRIKKERSRKLASLHRRISLEKNKKLIGREFKVLVIENGKNNTLLARTNSYKQVVLRSGEIGGFQKVRINAATPTYLIA